MLFSILACNLLNFLMTSTQSILNPSLVKYITNYNEIGNKRGPKSLSFYFKKRSYALLATKIHEE